MTPYAGNPDNFAEDIDVFGSDPPTATNFNTPIEALADRTAWLRSIWGAAACDYGPVVASTTLLPSSDNVVYATARWSPDLRAFLIAGASAADGPNETVFRVPNGYDGTLGANAPNVSSGDHTDTMIFDCLYDAGTTHYLDAGIGGSNQVIVHRCAPGGAWSGVYTDNSATFVHATLHRLGSQILLAYSTATITLLFYSTDGGATWTNTTYAVAATGSVGEIIVDNGSTALVIACGAGAGYIYGTSGAGVWTTVSAPWGTDTPYGATYARDNVGPCFYVVTKPSGGGMNVWKSADGISWVQVGGTTLSFNPQSMASIGSVLAVSADIAGGLTRGVYVSLDYGVSWRPATSSPLKDSTAFPGLRPLVVASDNQFLCLWQAGLRWSRVVYPPGVAA